MSRLAAILAFAVFSTSQLASAFPEMVRHNYPNCIACHISPNGGGVLTQYGRELSRAVLSTWGTENENESKFAWGVINPPSWLDVMGMYRGVYAYQSTPSIQQGEYIFMQNDLEAAAHNDQWYLDLALGYQNPPNATTFTDYLISRRYFVNYRPTDQLSFRIGRFFPTYGILTAEHIIPIKADLGWDQGQESDNAEAAYIGDNVNLFVTGVFGRIDQPSLNRDLGFALGPSLSFSDHYKVGVSYYYGHNSQRSRNVFGPWGILGFTPHFFMLSELDFQQASFNTGTTQFGAVNYQKLDYEIIQGLHFYITQDFSQLDFSNPGVLKNSYGVGVQFFPRPHFEIDVSWQKLRNLAFAPDYTDFAWPMINFYL